MKNDLVRDFYDKDVLKEWNRLEKHYFEFEITKHFMNKYIKPGDSILDVSGGPGRYSLYFAAKGCDVTLVDLSPNNIEFAKVKAKELGLPLKAKVGDACDIKALIDERFDHVFLMGALYHLKNENDRIKATGDCISKVKPGGNFYASFISLNAGIAYFMREDVSLVLDIDEQKYISDYMNRVSYKGFGFTDIYFINPDEILPFMDNFDLEKLHYFGQEGIISPAETRILEQPIAVRKKWLDIAIKVCEKKEFLSFPEHLMYIGRKPT